MAKKASRRKAASSSESVPRKDRSGRRSNKRAGGSARASARTGAEAASVAARRKTGRKTAAAKSRGQERKRRSKAAPSAKRPTNSAAAGARAKAERIRAGSRPSRGGTGMERDLAQTPETGRIRARSDQSDADQAFHRHTRRRGNTRQAPGLERARRQLREVEETVPSPPSSLDSIAGRRPREADDTNCRRAAREHTEVSPDITAGDVDADWAGCLLGRRRSTRRRQSHARSGSRRRHRQGAWRQYEDNEELKAADKISKRDKHRWELDPASSDDYQDRD